MLNKGTSISTVLIIGAGAAGQVVVKKYLLDPAFTTIHVASRTYRRCEELKEACNHKIHIHQLDADNTDDTIALVKKIKPALIINMALPYQDLSIMDACLKTNTHYMDTANYEPKDTAKFCYQWQWDYHEAFKKQNIMALLGSGFDPGVTNVFIKYASETWFDEIEHIDIIDCNDGDMGIHLPRPIQKLTYEKLHKKENTGKTTMAKIPLLSVSKTIDFPEIGKTAFLLYHEELESLVKHFPSIKQLLFWMTFSENYLTHLNVLQNVGMTSITPIKFKGTDIIPLEFLKELLPNPGDLSSNYKGKTCIGCIITGKKIIKENKVIV